MSQEFLFAVGVLCAAIGLYTAYRRGRLRRTFVLALLLFLVPVILTYFRQ